MHLVVVIDHHRRPLDLNLDTKSLVDDDTPRGPSTLAVDREIDDLTTRTVGTKTHVPNPTTDTIRGTLMNITEENQDRASLCELARTEDVIVPQTHTAIAVALNNVFHVFHVFNFFNSAI